MYNYLTTPVKRVPMQIRWAEDDRVIVSGSDLGVVYVFDVDTSERVEVIHHDRGNFVQTITVSVNRLQKTDPKIYAALRLAKPKPKV